MQKQCMEFQKELKKEHVFTLLPLADFIILVLKYVGKASVHISMLLSLKLYWFCDAV